MGLSWMAWTWPTAAFFIFIGVCLAAMAVWEWRVPGGGPRYGLLGLATTRGDRLFIWLLGSAFIFPGVARSRGHAAVGAAGDRPGLRFRRFSVGLAAPRTRVDPGPRAPI